MSGRHRLDALTERIRGSDPQKRRDVRGRAARTVAGGGSLQVFGRP